jgi:phage terminase large subunit
MHPEISLPFNWNPRPYQYGLWGYLERGGKRGLAVCHRRWGKDEVALHWTATSAFQKPATYWHMLPEYEQGRKAIWTAVNPHTGKRRIDEAFPLEIRENTNDQQMFIRFKNGATWQVVGSDNYNSVVGSPPYGVVMSEWALANPSAWAYLEPILLENDGWSLFLYTSRGKNHGYSLYQAALRDPEWHVERQTAEQTGVFDPVKLQKAKNSLIALYGEEDGEALFEQEYFCSFEAAVIGSYYGRLIARLERDGKIVSVPYNPNYPVQTAWDLGVDDATVVWFVQIIDHEIRVIDYLEVRNQSLLDTARELLKKPYAYAEHYLPHDVETREQTTAKTRKQALEEVGLRPIRAGSQLPVSDGINAVRNLLPRCVFDAKKCEKGLNALREYRVDWDDKLKTPRKNPLHNWASHPADAFRELAVQLFDWKEAQKRLRQQVAHGDYDPAEVGTDYARHVQRREAYSQATAGLDYDPF